MKRIFFVYVLYLLIVSTKIYAEEISTDVGTLTSGKNMNEDLTVTSTGVITCDADGCVNLKQPGLTVTNSGTIKTIGTNQNNTIVSSKDDSTVLNYGTISNSSSNAAIRFNDLSDSDGDGVSGYIYNSGTIETTSAAYTIRIPDGSYYKIDNYGNITNSHANGQTIYITDTENVVINNYSSGIISATNNSDGGNASKGAINTDANNISSGTIINNWGTIIAAHDTIALGTSDTINNYGKIESINFSDSPAIIMKGNNNTVNLYDGTLLLGWIDDGTDAGTARTGSTLNLDLCSSYNFKVVGDWTVNDNSGCGTLDYSGGYAKFVSALSQSVADEISALRVDHINDTLDLAKEKMKEGKDFVNFSSSYTDRNNKRAVDKFAAKENSATFGTPFDINNINGYRVFNVSNNNIDLLNQNISEDTFQAGLFFHDADLFKDAEVGVKSIFGYHNFSGERIQLDNTISSGKKNILQDYHSFSSIIGTNLNKNFKSNKNSISYLKSNLDINFDAFLRHAETDHVTWNSRLLGQFMGDISYGWKKKTQKNFSLNPELTVGFRTIIAGEEQKYKFNGISRTFNNGVQKDISAKLSFSGNYYINEKTNLNFLAFAKKTTEDQETYSLNIGFKSIF